MIKESEYKHRREKILNTIKKNSIAIVSSACYKIRSNDTEYPYRQNSNFYYLCGLKEDKSCLMFIKTDKIKKVFLFVKEMDEVSKMWLGDSLGVKKAKKLFDVDKVYPYSMYKKILQKYISQIHTVYFEFSRDTFFEKKLKKYKQDFYTCKNISKIIEQQRIIKSPSEIELIKKALKITKKAHHKVMKINKVGLKEYQIQAIFEYIFKKNGAYSDAYTTIVAGGNNANTLHYIKNDKTLKKGELVLIDAGCEYEYYASDITRTIPVDNSFSKHQKEVFDVVLDTQNKIISMIKEGVLRSELQKESEKLLCKALVKLGILKGNIKKLLKQQKHKIYYPHGIGHFMGIDVHDQNPYKDKNQKETVLKEGMVLTIEPGLYFPKKDKNIPKKYRGIGIRIEDNILVKKDGYENLSKNIRKF